MPQFFSQVQLLAYSLFTGDGQMISTQIDLGEDERSSTCSFSFYDPGLKIASYLFQLSQSSGGITTPQGLLEAPESGSGVAPSPLPSVPVPSPSQGASPLPVPTTPVIPTPSLPPTPTPSLPPGSKPAGVSEKSSTGVWLSDAAEGLKGDALAKKIIEYCRAIGVNSLNHQAYILATMTGETSNGQFLSEIGGASARYAPWYGRGIVQLKTLSL